MTKRSKALAAAAVLTVIFAIVYWMTRPTLADDAAAVVRAVLENDPATVYEYTHEFQRKQIRISRDQFVRYWQTLIAPRYGKYKPKGRIRAFVEEGGSAGIAWVPAYDAEGHRWDFDTTVWETGHGGRRSLMTDLGTVWRLEYIIEQGIEPTDSVLIVQALLTGLRRDRATLESLGITRIPGSEPGDPPVTLDEWERRLERLLQTVKQAAQRRERDLGKVNSSG